MKILVVHQHYLRPGQPGGSRFNELARLWAESGHEVTIVAGTLNYNTGHVPRRYLGRWVTREHDGLVTVYRCHVPRSYTMGYAGRMWAFLGFTLSAATAAMMADRSDVVIASSPPLIAAIPGWLAARARGRCPWIFEVRDLWPESATTTGVLREAALLTRGLYLLERWACWSAERVNVLTPAFRDNISGRGLAPVSKIVFVPNGADANLFRPAPVDPAVRDELRWGTRFVVLYAGAHGRANALRQLIDAARRLTDRPDIVIACVGDGPEREPLTAEVQRLQLDNIMFCGPQPKERMPALINACDVGAAVLQNNPTFRTVYPNKVFDYMACERATLLAIDGVARQLVCDEACAGVYAEPENPVALADAIRRLADDPDGRREMGQRGRQWVLANATREALAQRYLSIMQDMVVR